MFSIIRSVSGPEMPDKIARAPIEVEVEAVLFNRGRGRMIQLVVCLIVGRVGKDLLVRIFLRHQMSPLPRRIRGCSFLPISCPCRIARIFGSVEW